ncbi:MAG: peptide-methionine (S)-S-oxide reductase MsrA [Acidobacteriota bacterium]|nr:peptide-methionine (S)-S-oxide reductase MsrA [Acidobacteriota bacterium]
MTSSTRLGLATLVALGLGLASSSTAARQAAPESSRATAVFAGGCFWCLEQAFDEVDGVVETISGYAGGQLANPTYEQVSSGRTGHAEVVQVTYDPSKVSYATLLEAFWVNVDAVDGGGQFCDRGSQYRSAIFYASDEELRVAETSKQGAAAKLGQQVKTEIVKAGPFYRAEEYHQDYYTKNPVRYKFYKWNCGRAQRLEALWGKTSKQ